MPASNRKESLAVPFSIRIFRKCVEYRVDTHLMRHLHLYDLECLLIQFDIQRVQEYLDYEQKKSWKEQGIKEVKDISGNEALKFLGR
jgi:hypothetical protein